MPKRKRPELDPKEQFKRFVETAKTHDLDKEKAETAFKDAASHRPARQKPSGQ